MRRIPLWMQVCNQPAHEREWCLIERLDLSRQFPFKSLLHLLGLVTRKRSSKRRTF